MKSKLVTLTLTFSLLVSLVASTQAINVFSAAGGNTDCVGGEMKKVENNSNAASVTYTDSQNRTIGQVGIKAGSDQSTDNSCTYFTSNGSNGCYQVTGLGTSSVTATKVGSGRDCKDISYVKFYAVQAAPSVSPTPNPTPSVSPSASPQVTPSATPVVSPSASPVASASPQASPAATPSATPTPSAVVSASPSASPAIGGQADSSPSATPAASSTPNASPAASAEPDSNTDNESGDVLGGTTTLATTGSAFETIALSFILIGVVLVGSGLVTYRKATVNEA